jgi:hypothetical protein
MKYNSKRRKTKKFKKNNKILGIFPIIFIIITIFLGVFYLDYKNNLQYSLNNAINKSINNSNYYSSVVVSNVWGYGGGGGGSSSSQTLDLQDSSKNNEIITPDTQESNENNIILPESGIISNTTEDNSKNITENITANSLCKDTSSIQDLILYIPFNNEKDYGEDDKTVHDFSTNNFSGTVSNAIWNPIGGKFGDGAFEFNGIDSLITVPDTPLLSPANFGEKFTVAFWIRFDTFDFTGGSDTSNHNALHFLGKYSTNGDNREWYFRLHNATAIDGVFRGKRVSFYAFSPDKPLGTGSYFQPGISNINGPTPDYKEGEWMYVVGVIDGVNTKIYLNGILRDKDPLINYNVIMGDTKALFFIGRYDAEYQNYKDFQGSIDELRVYNRDLSDSEILELYNLKSCTY